MNTDEIIRRLDLIGESYKSIAAELLPESEASACMEAKNLAIQAVTALKEIKKELHGHCEACKHAEKHTYEPPCDDCINCGPFDDDGVDHWEWRWPLGEDTTT